MKYVYVLLLSMFLNAMSYAAEISEAEESYLNGDYQAALSGFLPLATPGVITPAGDLAAQYYLGQMFYYGSGVKRNIPEALKWLQLSAQQDDPEAMHLIGTLYTDSDWSEQSTDRAVEWYSKAIAFGSEEARASLGLLYVYEEGAFQDLDAGLEMLTDSADAGVMDAQFYLGVIHYDGQVVEQNIDLSLSYFRMAEEQGDEEALEFITLILNEARFAKSYDGYLEAMRLSPEDEDAFRCENFTWALAYGMALESHDNDQANLLEFSEGALDRINSFGESLEARMINAQYMDRQEYRELDAWWTRNYEESNYQLQSQSRSDLPFDEQLLFDRQRTGVFEIAFDPSFVEVMDSMSDDDFLAMWDDCVTRHMPEGFFSSDIGIVALEDAIEEDNVPETSVFSDVANWSRSTARRISELDVCQGDLDFAGGAAIGTLATSTIAGDSMLVVIGSSGLLVATAPAVATGVTIAAMAGSAVYLSARGYCYLTN